KPQQQSYWSPFDRRKDSPGLHSQGRREDCSSRAALSHHGGEPLFFRIKYQTPRQKPQPAPAPRTKAITDPVEKTNDTSLARSFREYRNIARAPKPSAVERVMIRSRSRSFFDSCADGSEAGSVVFIGLNRNTAGFILHEPNR